MPEVWAGPMVRAGMSVYIELPCGCVIGETYVSALCLKHFHALLEKKAQVEKETAENNRVVEKWFRDSLDNLQSRKKPKA